MSFDGSCDLECQGKGGAEAAAQRHEFIGPVKIVLVESTPVDYKRKVWGSAVFTFVMLLLGATVFTVFFFTLKFQLPFMMNVHVLLCTMGFQLFMTTGIMMFSSLFGGSMLLKPGDRKWQHFFLEVSGLFFGVLGTGFSLGNMSASAHALTGIFAASFSIISCLVGPSEYAVNPEKLFGLFHKKAHRIITVPTFLLGTICFGLGLMKDSFMKWPPCPYLPYILIVFTIIYSGTAMLSVVLRFYYDC